MNPRDIRRLEVEATLAQLHATQCEARAKAAVLEVERAQLAPFGAAPAMRSGLGFVVVVLAIGLAVALASAVADAPDHTARTAPATTVAQ